MLYLMGILLIVLGFIFKRSKLVYIMQIIFLILTMGGNTANPDYINYKYMFDHAMELLKAMDTREPLFLVLNILARFLKMSFNQFYFTYMGLCILLLNYVLKKYTKAPAPILSMFIIYPMVESTIQIRTFAAMIFLIWGFRYLIDRDNKYGGIKYLFLVFISSMFHISFLFYSIFALLRYFKERDWLVIIQLGTFGVCILIPLMPIIFNKVIDVGYFSEVSRLSTLKVLGMCVWQVSGVVILQFIRKSYFKEIPPMVGAEQMIMRINMTTCLILPLYFGGNTFMRLYRNVFLLNYIYINYKKNSLFKIIFILYLVCTALFFNILAGNGLNEVFRPIYENNFFLGN